jgi:hypothetical protein
VTSRPRRFPGDCEGRPRSDTQCPEALGIFAAMTGSSAPFRRTPAQAPRCPDDRGRRIGAARARRGAEASRDARPISDPCRLPRARATPREGDRARNRIFIRRLPASRRRDFVSKSKGRPGFAGHGHWPKRLRRPSSIRDDDRGPGTPVAGDSSWYPIEPGKTHGTDDGMSSHRGLAQGRTIGRIRP